MQFIEHLREAAHRETERFDGLVTLLMRPRNGIPWSAAAKVELRRRLLVLGRRLPWIGLLALPPGGLLLPLIALALDRRARTRRSSEDSLPGSDGEHAEP